jgi:hypothetical protein
VGRVSLRHLRAVGQVAELEQHHAVVVVAAADAGQLLVSLLKKGSGKPAEQISYIERSLLHYTVCLTSTFIDTSRCV